MSEYSDAKLLLIPSGKKDGVLYSQKPTDGLGDFTVDRNSPVWAMGKDGVLVETPANVPVFEWEDGKPHLLTQPQSTNLITYSNDFSDASWVKSLGDITISSELSLDGLSFMSKFTPTIENGSHWFNIAASGSANDHTLSVFVKLESGSAIKKVTFYPGGGGSFAHFNLEDMTSTKEVNVVDNYIQDYGNGFYRLVAIYDNTIITDRLRIYASSGSIGASITTENGIDGIYIYQADLIDSSYAQSPIFTNGTTVTRLADVITVTPPVGTTEIIETIDNVEQTPITVIPATYTIPEGKINKIVMK